MPDEVVEVVVDQEELQAEKDMEAGFTSAHVEPTKPAEVKAEPETKTEEPAPAKAAVETQEEPRVFGMTEAEFKAELAKTGSVSTRVDEEVRKLYAKLGEYNRTIQDLSKKISAGGSTASRKITADKLKRVNEELPGLGDALAADLAEFFESPAAQAEVKEAAADAAAKGEAFDPESYFAEKLSPALMAMEARMQEASEMKLVKFMHPDFDTVCKSPDFDTWLKTLPAEKRKSVVESTDALVAAGAVTDFKTWRDAKAKAQATSKTRLERATPARGGSTATTETPDEDAELASGFASVRKVR